MNFDLTSYYTMQQYIETLEWMIFPLSPTPLTVVPHRLFINSDSFNGVGEGDYMVFECDITPNPDMFPDVWNSMFLKRLHRLRPTSIR